MPKPRGEEDVHGAEGDGGLASGHRPMDSSRIEVLGCLSGKGPEGCNAWSRGWRGSCHATQRRPDGHTCGSVWEEEWGGLVTVLRLPNLGEGML